MEKITKKPVLEMTESEVLKFIAEYRENSITIKNSVFYEEIQETRKERQNAYCKFEQELKESIKDESKLKQVMKVLEDYITAFNNEHGIYYNHYYVTAIKDVVKLLNGE